MPQSGIQPASVPALAPHDLLQVQRPVDHDDADDRDAEGDLVGDHLRRRPQSAQQRVVVARGEAGQDHAVHAQRQHRKDVEQRDVDLGDLQLDDAVAEHERDRRTGCRQTPPARRTPRRTGASVWRTRSAPAGMMSSFVNILTASASGWNSPINRKPKMLARFAPIRSCMMADCLRSTQVCSPARFRTPKNMMPPA